MTATRQMAIFTIGPVQSFIASARRTEDLWSGSYILSFLVERAIETLYDTGRELELIFPQVSREDIRRDNKRKEKTLNIASLPNRLTALISGGETEVAEVMQKTENAVREAYKQLCFDAIRRVFPDSSIHQVLQSQAEEQVDALLEVYWVVQPYVAEVSFREQQTGLESRLNALKNDKNFAQFVGTGLTCRVCEERDALTLFPPSEDDRYGNMRKKLRDTWQQRSEAYQMGKSDDPEEEGYARIEDNEYLCGVCLGKRTARDYYQHYYRVYKPFASFPSTADIGTKEQRYFAILKMDGDNMGKWLSGETLDQYREVSKRLAHFAAYAVPRIVQSHEGIVIYAGGDDVLAFLPADRALKAAWELRRAFSIADHGIGPGATASVGIVLGHKTAPLHHLLNEVRKMESLAKSYQNRMTGEEKNALAIAVHTRSGEIVETVVPWKIDSVNTVDMLNDWSVALEEKLSSTFIYRLTEAFLPLVSSRHEKSFERKDMFQSEFRRLLRRSTKEGETVDHLDELVSDAMRLHEALRETEHFFRLLKMLTFFRRKGVKRG